MASYKNYFLGSVSQISDCVEIILFNKSSITERISLTNLEYFYSKYLTGFNTVEYTRLGRDDSESLFEYKKDLPEGFDIIVYISPVSNSPIGYTEFLNTQGVGLTIGIGLNITRSLSGFGIDIIIENHLTDKNLRKDWQGTHLYNYSKRSDITGEKKINPFTSDIGRLEKDSFSFILGSSGVTTKKETHRLNLKKDIEISSLGNYSVFYYKGDLVLAEWSGKRYKMYSLLSNGIYEGNTTIEINKITGRYYIGVDKVIRDLETGEAVEKTKKFLFCDYLSPGNRLYDLPVFYTKTNVFKYIPEINNIYLDLDNYLKSNQLMIVGKIGSWFILERKYGGSNLYIAVSPTSVLTMTVEDLERALFINDQTIILREDSYNLVYHVEEKNLLTERSRVILLGGRLSDYTILEEGSFVCKIQMCFLDTEEDQEHYDEYFGSELVNIVFNFENLSETVLNQYRRSIYPKCLGIPELIGSYGSLVFYKIGNKVNVL